MYIFFFIIHQLLAHQTAQITAKYRSNKNHQSHSLLDDASAVVVVSGDRTRLGEILSVNAGIVRLFGFSRSGMVSCL